MFITSFQIKLVCRAAFSIKSWWQKQQFVDTYYSYWDLLELYFLTGIVQKPQIQQYWRTDPLLKTSVFNQVMIRNSFQKILQFLQFTDNSNYDATEPGHDKLFNVIVEFLVDHFKTVYIPSENFYFTKGGYHLNNIFHAKEKDLEKSCLVYVKTLTNFGILLFILIKLPLMKINISWKGALANQALLFLLC